MKSYFLDHISSIVTARAALNAELPGQKDPWVIVHASGDPIAYLRVGTELEDAPNLHIQADMSGQHYEKDRMVIELLERLQVQVGGSISSDA
jgi:hypothetical protein